MCRVVNFNRMKQPAIILWKSKDRMNHPKAPASSYRKPNHPSDTEEIILVPDKIILVPDKIILVPDQIILRMIG